MPDPLPTAGPASPWIKHLERAHSLSHEAARAIGEEIEPSPFLLPAARLIARGVASMYDAFDGRSDRLSAIGVAHGRLWEGAILVARAGLGGALAALRGACAELVAAEARFPNVTLAGRPEQALRASIEDLPLHAVARASVTPSFRAPPVPEPEGEDEEEAATAPLPDPTTFADLAAVAEMAARRTQERIARRLARRPDPAPAGPVIAPAPPPGFAGAPGAGISEGAFIQRWARHCFEEIGMLGLQRAPLAGDDWRTSLPIERRLLHAVDAVAALGARAVSTLEPLALDAPAANPMAVFAISLLGGCLEGRDVLGGAERVLHHFGAGDPIVADPFTSAMKLAPNPFVPGMLRSLLGSGDRASRAIAVEVLAHRGWLTDADLSALAEDEDARVFARVLPALSIRRHRDLDRALERALGHADLRVQEAALEAMALAAHPRAAAAARAAAEGALGDRALVPLALVGDEGDARWLLSRIKGSPSKATIEALGWAGLLEAVPVLMGSLESEDDEVKLAAGAALDRLLGANMVEAFELQPEAAEDVLVVDPDPDPPKRRPPLAGELSDPRDMPSPGSPETIDVPSIDPAKWQAYWAAHGGKLDKKQRIRRGYPYSPSVSLYELDRLPLGPVDRRRLFRELCARTGRVVGFDPDDLVVVQERSLAAWGAAVKAMGEVPGAWGRGGRR